MENPFNVQSSVDCSVGTLENKNLDINPGSGDLAWEVSGGSLRVLQRLYQDYLFDVWN